MEFATRSVNRRLQRAETLGYCPSTSRGRVLRTLEWVVAGTVGWFLGASFGPEDELSVRLMLRSLRKRESFAVTVSLKDDTRPSRIELAPGRATLVVKDALAKDVVLAELPPRCEVNILACPVADRGKAVFSTQLNDEIYTIGCSRRAMEVLAKTLTWQAKS